MNIVPDFVAKESCGSLDSIYYVNAGAAHLTFVEDGLPLHFERQPSCALSIDEPLVSKTVHESIRIWALMPLYKSPLHVVARKGAGWTDFHDIRPLAKAYLGPSGGATAVVAQLVLDHYGIVVDRQGADLDFHQAARKLLTGELEVGFFLVALSARATGMVRGQGNAARYQCYLRRIRARTMNLLRQRRILFDDVERVNEYMKSHT